MFVYITLLLLTGLLFLFMEMFVPGGVIGSIGVVLFGVAIYLCFNNFGSQVGFTVMLLCCAVTLGIVLFWIKVLPQTAIGKMFILSEEISNEKGCHANAFENTDLVGQEGITESELRPVGIALIDGNRVDVMTEGDYVEPNSRIRVIREEGNRIVVEQM